MTGRRILTACLLVTGASIFVGCGEPSPGTPRGFGWSGSVDTLPSGRVVVRSADVPSWSPSEAWSLERRGCVGSLEGDGPDVFGGIRDLEIGPSGNVFVLDGQANEIRVFDPEGTPVRTFARKGEGPGELNAPNGMAFGPDGLLWVVDSGNARYTAFDPATGDLADERRRPSGFGMIPWPGGFDDAGRLLDVGLHRQSGEPSLIRLDTAFVSVDTLALPRPDERHRVAFTRDGVLMMTMMMPFAPQPSWAPHPHGGIVIGRGEAFRLHWIGVRSDTLLTLELDRTPVPVTGAERDSALAAFRDRIERFGEGLEPDRDPEVAATKPAHGSPFVDDLGRIWVGRVEGTGTGWDVFGADGRYLGPVSVPSERAFTAPSVRDGKLALATRTDLIPRFCVFDLIEGR